MAQKPANAAARPDRVQTGLRMDRTMLKVLKGLAEYLDLSLADLIELMVLHNFEGKATFSRGTLRRVEQLKQVYDMQYDLARARAILFTRRR